MFGYDPHVQKQRARSRPPPGLLIGPDEVIFRCNFVTILGCMCDFTAGHISQTRPTVNRELQSPPRLIRP